MGKEIETVQEPKKAKLRKRKIVVSNKYLQEALVGI
jgi:hypothetical protein